MNPDDPTIPDSNTSESSDESSSPRPNRWKGPSPTWTNLTSEERGLAASLDQIRNQDLSVHLYNAHALKRRAREYAVNPEEVKKEYPTIPDEDQIFKPPKSWTAWPLPPDQVPREGEQIGPEDENESYTFKRREVERASRELEDVVLGVTLRFAKERFLGREVEDEEEYSNRENDSMEGKTLEEVNSSLQDWERSDEEGDVVVKEDSMPPQKERLIPVVSADDDRSRNILRPSIRHTLAKLDEILIALHHARKTCRRLSHSSVTSANSDNEAETDGEGSVSPSKRGRGRPRKFADLPVRSRAQSIPHEGQKGDEDLNNPELFRGKTTHRGRPLRAYERLEGESQQEYITRIAQIQKKVLPSFAPPREVSYTKSPTPSPEKSRKSPTPRTASEELDRQRRMRLHPRDWSEVFSSAALVGFPQDVIARATQRCANLFGESMTMRIMVEAPYFEKITDVETRYNPEQIPNFDDEELEVSSNEVDSSEVDSSEESTGNTPIKIERPNSRTLRVAQVPPSKQTCFCPMSGCPRRIHGFRDSDALKSHLRLGHKIAKNEVEDYILPSDEEMDGAVHIDGFLRPLKRLGGARGSYKKVAKRVRVESGEGEGSANEEPKTRDLAPGESFIKGKRGDDKSTHDNSRSLSDSL